MILYIFGTYIGQTYSSVQYKIHLIDDDEITNNIIKLYEDETIKRNNIESSFIEYIIFECSYINDFVCVNDYRWSIELEY